jgi:hypothetical protein
MDNLKTIRSILFKTWLINLAFVTIFWAFAYFNLTLYFAWVMPDLAPELVNEYVMWLAGAADLAGLVLFLVPALGLSWHIRADRISMIRLKKKLGLYDEMDELDDEDELMFTEITPIDPITHKPLTKKPIKLSTGDEKPAAKKTAAKKKPAAKKKK